MKVKTKDLIGAQLDWAVGIAQRPDDLKRFGRLVRTGRYSPSTDGSQGIKIIEDHAINTGTQRNEPGFRPHPDYMWHAQMDTRVHSGYGPTLLIACMRCFVASKWGDEVEVPDELA